MRAVVQAGYGDPWQVLSTAEVDPPRPEPDEVLVQVAAASVHPDVWHVVTGRPWALRLMGAGPRRPRRVVPGTDMAGTVVEVGDEVSGFAPGDAVFGETLRGLQWNNGGAWAELVASPVTALTHLPDGVDPVAAATVPTAGLIVLANLAATRGIEQGSQVLVNGAAGGVGSIATQVLKARGAVVTGVDHGDRLELVQALGADAVVDFTTTDASAGGGPYDLVFDIPGNHAFGDWQRVLAADGTYVLIGHDAFGRQGRRMLGSIPRMVGLMARAVRSPQLPTPGSARFDRAEGIRILADHLAAGELTPVVAHRFDLDEAAEALQVLADGAAGRIVLVP